jgi:hypothetical protein
VGETLVVSLPLATGVLQAFLPIRRFEWDWSAGGGVTTTTHNTAISLTASRAVSNGGGLLTDVNSDFASLGVARRLPYSWLWSSTLNYGYSEALTFGGLPGGSFNTEIGQVSVSRQFGEHVNLSFDYQHYRQREGSGNLGFNDLDRDMASIRFNWDVLKVPFGRRR